MPPKIKSKDIAQQGLGPDLGGEMSGLNIIIDNFKVPINWELKMYKISIPAVLAKTKFLKFCETPCIYRVLILFLPGC